MSQKSEEAKLRSMMIKRVDGGLTAFEASALIGCHKGDFTFAARRENVQHIAITLNGSGQPVRLYSVADVDRMLRLIRSGEYHNNKKEGIK